MNYFPLMGFYFRNQAQLKEIEAKLAGAVSIDGSNPLMLLWIQSNIAVAQREWPQYKDLLSDLNTTLAEVLVKP